MKTCLLKSNLPNHTYPFLKKVFPFFIFSLFFTSCTPEPQPIEFGTDACHYCKMTIVDHRYGAQLVTKKGRVYKFDATECMVNAIYADKLFSEENIHSMLTVAYDQPRQLIPATSAHFFQSSTLPSPMGMFLTAFSSPNELENAKRQHNGVAMNWENVKDAVLEKVRR